MASSRDIARLEELIEEHDKPWRNEEAMNLILEVLDKNQKVAAEALGCSSATISTWREKLNIGEGERVREEQKGGGICVRCEENETPDNPQNDLCNECIDRVRSQSSSLEVNADFSPEVVGADDWTA